MRRRLIPLAVVAAGAWFGTGCGEVAYVGVDAGSGDASDGVDSDAGSRDTSNGGVRAGTFSIGGTVSELHNDGLTLALAAGDQSVTLDAGDSAFTFPDDLPDGTDYEQLQRGSTAFGIVCRRSVCTRGIAHEAVRCSAPAHHPDNAATSTFGCLVLPARRHCLHA